jgi:hypothetical protein
VSFGLNVLFMDIVNGEVHEKDLIVPLASIIVMDAGVGFYKGLVFIISGDLAISIMGGVILFISISSLE